MATMRMLYSALLLLFGSLRATEAVRIAASALVHDSAGARAAEALRANETEMSDEEAGFYCADYCVQCDDGSTVWFGRSRSWTRAILTGVSIYLDLVATGGIYTGLYTLIHWMHKASKETFTSWTGYLPTSGLFCEKVDVVKFPMGHPDGTFEPLMVAEHNTYIGRILSNDLKPYDKDSHLMPGFAPSDFSAYVQGCKAVKAAGTQGSRDQFVSNFQWFCSSRVTRGVQTCATHSKLCGNGGGKVVQAGSYGECMALKGKAEVKLVCK